MIGGMAFIFISALEWEWHAVSRIFILLVPFVGIILIFLLVEFPGRLWLLGLMSAGIVATGFLFIIPMGGIDSLVIKLPQECVDERDAIFHRFYRLVPGSSDFKTFYRNHPEKREFDRSVRSLPQLGFPGSRTYDPLNSPYQSATFDVLESLTRSADEEPVDTARVPGVASPETMAHRIEGFARYLGADLVGITHLNPAYVYSHIGRSPGTWGTPIDLDHPYAIAIAVEMKNEMIRHAPDGPVITETSFAYFEAARIALIVSRYIQHLGFRARAHVDGNYRVLCVPIAADAGLGELGRLGLLITPEFGPRIRLSIVTTDIPLTVHQPRVFGVQDFCSFCKKCAESCPSGSIASGPKKMVRGVLKWQSDQESCYKFWRLQGTDCSVCIRVCPYSHPNNFLHNGIRYALSKNSLSRRLAMWADDFLYGRRPKQKFTPPDWHAGI